MSDRRQYAVSVKAELNLVSKKESRGCLCANLLYTKRYVDEIGVKRMKMFFCHCGIDCSGQA